MAKYAFNVAQTEIMFGLEATRGTAAANTVAEPVKAPKYKIDLTMLPDDTIQGSMVAIYDETRGLRYDSHGWDGYPRLETTFFPLLVAELGGPDTVTAAPASTTLAAAAAAGATSISTAASIAANSYIVIGAGGTLETHKTTSVSGTGPYTVTLATPLIYAQASGAAVTGLTQHTTSLLNNAGQGNQPPSATINDFDGDQWRQLTAAQLDELNLTYNATGLLSYTCTWFANPAVTPATPSPSYAGEPQPPPAWSAVVSIGGTQVPYIEELTWDMKRGVKPIPALQGTETYYLYYANPITPTVKITVIEQSGAPELTSYINGAKESLDVTLFDLTTGAALNLHSSSAIFTSGEIDRSAEGEVKAALDVQLLPSSADATAGGKSPLIATVANATTTAYAGS